jgi:Tfp pilus assembly protein PilF
MFDSSFSITLRTLPLRLSQILPPLSFTGFAVLLLFFIAPNALAQVGRTPAKPPRMFTISGQVSLPDGRPAADVIVKLSTQAGVSREAFTRDSGQFEFAGMDEGSYLLVARSLSDPKLVSEPIETDTSRTATGNLTVNITLRESAAAEKRKAGILRVDNAEQKIPKEARKAFNQGLKFKENNESNKALESFSRAIDLYPEYYQALSERGDIYVAQRKLADAGGDFERAVKINAHYGPALRGAGYCKLEQGEFAEAIQDFEQSVAADPDNANTHLLLGIANLQLDRREAAKTALLKALSFNPAPLRAHIHLANLYAKEHLYSQAADELRKYLDAQPGDPDRANLESIEAQWRARAAAPGPD